MSDQPQSAIKRTALYETHVKLGAKMVPFAGYEMPVQYSGILTEHKAVRQAVGMFDVSHMGEVTAKGSGALDFVQKITVNNAALLQQGQAQYSAMCYADGGIIDDLLVYKRGDNDYLLVINASNIDKDYAWMQQNAGPDVQLENVSEQYTLLAVQGPLSVPTLQKLTDTDLSAIEYYHFADGLIADVPAIISRTGYTGEPGFELYIAADPATVQGVWDAVMQAGAEYGIMPAGLGARDTLRLEMGYCLYGNDIDQTTNTLEAGLGWITKLDKGPFNGSDVLAQVKADKPKRKLVGFRMSVERAIPRHGYTITADGRQIGHVTSGTMSPSLGIALGLGYVETTYAKTGTPINIVIRDKEYPAEVAKIPFMKKETE